MNGKPRARRRHAGNILPQQGDPAAGRLQAPDQQIANSDLARAVWPDQRMRPGMMNIKIDMVDRDKAAKASTEAARAAAGLYRLPECALTLVAAMRAGLVQRQRATAFSRGDEGFIARRRCMHIIIGLLNCQHG